MSIYVFLGPTLPVARAKELLDAVYLPPVAMGDVHDVLARKPSAIVIIDGLFEQVPSVWHKEILLALEAGIRVFGASSMGALRAAELWPFGMEGVGRIFEWFKSGHLEDDDEVAVVHGAASTGHQPLSEAMVNFRDGLERAVRADVLSAVTSQKLIALAKQMFYADRSWPALIKAGHECGIGDVELKRLEAFVRQERPNLKQEDAISLLRHVHAEAIGGMMPHVPVFRTERTVFLQQMVESVERPSTEDLSLAAGGVTSEALGDHLRAMAPHYEEIRRNQLLGYLVQREAARLGIYPTAKRVQEASERFRRARGLGSVGATEAWMADNGLSTKDFRIMIELQVLADELFEQFKPELRSLLLVELRRRGEFVPIRDAVTRKKRSMRAKGLTSPTLDDASTNLEELVGWYEHRYCRIEGTLEQHALSRGFDSVRNFLAEVLEQYLQEKCDDPCDGRGRLAEGDRDRCRKEPGP